MTLVDLLTVIAWSAAIAAVVGLLAWFLLRRFAGASIVVHLVTVVIAAVAAVVGGVLVATQAMYLSDHDARIALIIAITSGIVAIVTASLLGMEIARAARVLRRAAEGLGRGEPVASAGPHPTRETGPKPGPNPSTMPIGEFRAVLDELAASDARIRAARDEVEQQEQRRRELVARVAHDLRVPLAGIRAQAEALQDGLAPDPERYLARIAAQVDRLDALVADLFAVSQLDAGRLELRRERLSLADLASDGVAELRSLAASAGVDLEFEASAAGTVDGDALQLGRAVANLIANAVEHSPRGGRVAVSVVAADGSVVVRVADQGPGFAPDDLEHAFEAGWRGSEARSPHRLDLSGGAGLGLAIVRGIARAHGGDSRLGNGPSGGAVVEFSVPEAS